MRPGFPTTAGEGESVAMSNACCLVSAVKCRPRDSGARSLRPSRSCSRSSLHSYLILAYAGSEKAAEDVGFYYVANAAGRLLGITLSGVLYQVGGITGCLIGSAVMLSLCCMITFLIPMFSNASTVKRAAA